MNNPYNCRNCDLCLQTKSQLKPTGSNEAHIMFLFDCPNHSQNAKNDFFAGKRMQLFKRRLIQYGLFKYGYFTTILKCKPTRSDVQEFKDIELSMYHCSNQYFLEEFAKLDRTVKLVVAFGKFTYQYVSGNHTLNFYQWKGMLNVPHEIGNFIVIPVPALASIIYENQLTQVIDNINDVYRNKVNFAHKLHKVPVIQ